MKKVVLVIFTLVISLNVFGQRQRRPNISDRIPRAAPSEKDIEKRDRMMKERREEFIANFLTTLEADDFQKQIIKQHLDTFYDAKVAILKTKYEHNLDLKNAVKKLEDTHFKDLDDLISEGDMAKIKEMITGGFDEKEVVKEKKKKKKKRKKRNKD